MRQLLTACIIALAAAVTLQAQQQWHEMVGNPKENFYSIQRRAYEYWKDKDSTQKGAGWKQFKRWEWFWQQRVNPDGSFPSTADNDRLALESRGKRDQQGVLSNSWQSLGPSSATGGYWGLGRINTVAVHPTDTNRLWVGAAGGGLWRTTDRGATWEPRTDNWPTLGIGDVAYAPSNPQVMYVATGDPYSSDYYSIGLRKSTNGGETWAETGLKYNITDQVRMNRIAVHPQTPDMLLVGSSDGLWRSTNGGTTWARTVTNNWIRDIELHPWLPSTVYAVTNNGSILRSTDFGLSWNASTLVNSVNPARGQLAVSRSNAAVVYAVFSTSGGSFEGLYRSLDTGKTFSKQSNTPNILNSSSNGAGGGGQGWYDLSMTVDPQNHNVLIVGAVNLWRSTNGGTSWNIIGYWNGGLLPSVPEIHADHHFLTYDNRGILYVCNDGGLYFSHNKGNSYTWKSDGIVNMQFYRLGVAPDGSTIAGAQDNSSRLYTQQQWYEALWTGDGMDCDADPQNSSILYTSSYYGAISRTNNGGKTFRDWSQIASRESIGENAAWIAPYEVNPNDGKMITAGFVNTWRSIDSGQSWSQLGVLNNTSPLTALAVAPSNPNVIYASTGFVHWVTTDGGTSWTAITSLPSLRVSSIAVHPSNPARVWFTSSNFTAGQKVFLSTNYAASVSNTSAGLPNVPANTLVVDTAGGVDRLYVGTDIGVWTKRYVDADWAAYNDGLPNVIIDDLKIWHSARRLRAATYGRGLFDAPMIALAPPVARFSTSKTRGCVPLGVNFYDLSTGFPATWEWDFNGDGTTDTLTQSPSFLFSEPGVYNVRLRVRNTAGESVFEQTINVYAPMELPLPDTIMACGQESLEIDGGGVTGGSGEYEWEWDINVPFQRVGRSKIVISSPTDANLTLTVRDNSGCWVDKRVLVRLSKPLVLSGVGNDTLCPGGMRIISTKVSGGRPPYSWQWGNHSAIQRVISQGIAEVSAAESTTITVTVTDALKCSTTFTIGVPVGPRFAISMADTIEACAGVPVTLSAQVQGDLGQSFSWTPAQGLSNAKIPNPTVLPGAAGTWTLVARSRYGCLDTHIVVVTRIEQPLGNITSDRGTTLCPGDSLVLSAPAGVETYRWNTGHTSRSINVRDAGEYYCVLGSGECESVTDTISVVYGNQVDKPGAVLIETAGSFALSCTTDADYYRWYRDGELIPNETSRTLQITQSGSYVVRTWDDDKCYADSDPYVVTISSVNEYRSTDVPVLYPNPVAEELTVEWGQDWASGDELTFECSDLQGRRLFTVTVNASDRRTVVPVGSLVSGSYSLYVVSGAKRVVLPFIRR